MIEPYANTPESGRRFWKPQVKGTWTDTRYSYPFEALVLRRKAEDALDDAPTVEGYILCRATAQAVATKPAERKQGAGPYRWHVRILLLDLATFTQLVVFRDKRSKDTYPNKQKAFAAGGSVALGTAQKMRATYVDAKDPKLKGITLRRRRLTRGR